MSTILGIAATALAALAGYYKLRNHTGPVEPTGLNNFRLPVAIVMAVAQFFMSMLDVYDGTRPRPPRPQGAAATQDGANMRRQWGTKLASDDA